MILRKILYISSGIINCVCGSIVSGLSLLMLLLSGIVRKLFENSYELVEGFIEGLVEVDPNKYSYLLEYSREESIDYIVKIAVITCIVFLVIGLLNILMGVLNIKLRNSHDRIFDGRLGRKIGYVLLTWCITGANLVSSIATTVAVFLKGSGKTENKLYSATDSD